jgi:hypothetical protein
MQNFALALFDAPHEGHCSGSGAPHPSQNFAPARFSEPQFEQRIESPGSQASGPSCITRCREGAAGFTRTTAIRLRARRRRRMWGCAGRMTSRAECYRRSSGCLECLTTIRYPRFGCWCVEDSTPTKSLLRLHPRQNRKLHRAVLGRLPLYVWRCLGCRGCPSSGLPRPVCALGLCERTPLVPFPLAMSRPMGGVAFAIAAKSRTGMLTSPKLKPPIDEQQAMQRPSQVRCL